MSAKKTILLVDDDRSLSPLVKEYLEAKDFVCHLHHNAYDAMNDFKKSSFSLCILDIRMPMKNGFQIAEEITALKPETPFLFLTGQTEKEDRIKGLEAGADDYITKPFSMQELYLRIKAILKRTENYKNIKKGITQYDIGKYKFNADTREIANTLVPIKLSAIETKLLKLFCEAEDGIVYRDTALKQIWEDENSFRERSLNVYVSKLRQYLKDDPKIEILNIHGTGYKLVVR
jgi:two-component system, OmpR family, response regulator